MHRFLKYVFMALVIIPALSCEKDPSLWQIENLNNNSVSVFGHGGMGINSLFPLDSYESISECLAMGADGSEMDLQMSKDSVLFVFHGTQLEESSSCSGIILNKSAAEIDCEYTSSVYKNIRIERLSTMFEKLNPKEGHMFTFECKIHESHDPAYLNAFANSLVRHVVEHGLTEKCLIESTEPWFLELLRSKNTNLKLFLYANDFNFGLQQAQTLSLYGLTFDMFKINKEQIRIAHQNNLRVALFNQQKERDNLDAIEMNADYIQTDKLEHALKVLDKFKK